MSEGEGINFVRAIRDDVLSTLNAILPKAINEVLDETIAEYKSKLKFEAPMQQALPKQIPSNTYATIASSHLGTQHLGLEIQRFNHNNRWYMNHMYHKRETAFFKQVRCERLSAIYEDCLKHQYVPRGFRKDNYNVLSLDEYKKLHKNSIDRFQFEISILKSRIPLFRETVQNSEKEVTDFVQQL